MEGDEWARQVLSAQSCRVPLQVVCLLLKPFRQLGESAIGANTTMCGYRCSTSTEFSFPAKSL
jgi:hypothetical protein